MDLVRSSMDLMAVFWLIYSIFIGNIKDFWEINHLKREFI